MEVISFPDKVNVTLTVKMASKDSQNANFE